jgi:HAD superfamily hydrolase (TIGR01509 family)
VTSAPSERPDGGGHVQQGQALLLDGIRGAVFDLDGVLTDTASLHRRAWGETFTDCFADAAIELGAPIAPFTDEDYLRLVDGRLRLDGARAVLVDRHLDRDALGFLEARAKEIATRKDTRFQALLAEEGPAPYATSLAFLRELRRAGIGVAVATGSRHAREVLRRSGIETEIDVLVDGRVAEVSYLRGKPAPDTFLEAATRLGEPAERCLAIDDALNGVAAGRAGGFVVVGVDRFGRHRDFRRAGADIVVSDLGDLRMAGITPITDPLLLLDPDDDDDREGVRESLFTLGNGYVATRGARAYVADDGHHYPGTYFAGVFDRLSHQVGGGTMDEDALVNAPNWLSLSFAVEGGPWLGSDSLVVKPRGLTHDLSRGLLVRRFTVTDGSGRRTSVLERRLVSMAEPHLAALETHLVAENWSGHLEVRAELDGAVRDNETTEEQLLGGDHLELVEAEIVAKVAHLAVRTVQSQIVLAQAQRASITGGGAKAHAQRSRTGVGQHFTLEVAEGQRVSCEKLVALHTSRDAATSDPLAAAGSTLETATGFSELLVDHEAAWARLWARSAVAVRDDTTEIQRLVNLHLFHVLQVASPHVVDRDVGIGARGLHGEGYLGHIFWDELFVLPMITRRYPSVARSLLSDRAHRLKAAQAGAAAEGHRGAMFPWQSASDGRDETPHLLYNARSGHWVEDRSRYQRHVGLAVAFNFWQYFETTGDQQHLFDVGAEVILNIALYFADLARFDEGLGRYRICGVIGPDEFHDGYPWRSEPGVDDNAYTNIMTAWLLERSLALVDLLRQSGRGELLERVGLGGAELEHFEDVSRRLHVPFMGEVLAQFDGYERLEELDLDAYRTRYGDLGRLDLILEAEGDTVRRYQVAKQPDALMTLFLFSAEELRRVLGRLGYGFDADAIRKTIDYYTSRVTHGSSLSRVVHAWINARLDRASSWRYLSEALEADVLDINRGATREGIHLGAMAGTIDIFERCYPGLEIREGALWLNPSLPDELTTVAFRVDYLSHLLEIKIGHEVVTIESPASPSPPVQVRIAGELLIVPAGAKVVHALTGN